MEGLPPPRPAPGDDARGRRVHPPLPSSRSPQRLPPHPSPRLLGRRPASHPAGPVPSPARRTGAAVAAIASDYRERYHPARRRSLELCPCSGRRMAPDRLDPAAATPGAGQLRRFMNRALDCTFPPYPVSAPLIGTAIRGSPAAGARRHCDGLRRPGYRRVLRRRAGRKASSTPVPGTHRSFDGGFVSLRPSRPRHPHRPIAVAEPWSHGSVRSGFCPVPAPRLAHAPTRLRAVTQRTSFIEPSLHSLLLLPPDGDNAVTTSRRRAVPRDDPRQVASHRGGHAVPALELGDRAGGVGEQWCWWSRERARKIISAIGLIFVPGRSSVPSRPSGPSLT